MGLHKILKIVGFILSLLAAIWLVRIVATGDTAIESDGALQDSLVTPFIYIAYITMAIAVILVFIFVLKGLASGNAKNTLIGLGAFLIVVAISYLLASGVETPLKDGEMLSANGSRWVSAGLNAFFILGGVAIVLMLLSGVKKIAKN